MISRLGPAPSSQSHEPPGAHLSSREDGETCLGEILPKMSKVRPHFNTGADEIGISWYPPPGRESPANYCLSLQPSSRPGESEMLQRFAILGPGSLVCAHACQGGQGKSGCSFSFLQLLGFPLSVCLSRLVFTGGNWYLDYCVLCTVGSPGFKVQVN